MRSMMEISKESADLIVKMRQEGASLRQIAKAVGCSPHYVTRVYMRETDPQGYHDKYIAKLNGRKKVLSKNEMAEEDFRGASEWRPAFMAVNALQRYMEMAS